MTYSDTTSCESFGQDLSFELRGLPLFDRSVGLPDGNTGVTWPPAAASLGRCASSLDNGAISVRELFEKEAVSDDASFEIGPGGLIVKMPWHGQVPVGGGRGKIRGFSPSSRRRLRRLNATVDWAKYPAYFVGLTYHDDFPMAYLRCTADLRAFRNRLYRAFGKFLVAVEWRREWKKRQSGAFEGHWAPHFHLVLLLAIEVPAHMLGAWIHRAWTDIVAPGDPDHLEHGSDVRKIYNASGKGIGKLMAYLSKYIAKECDGVPVDVSTGECLDVGRSWGVWGQLPISKLVGTMSQADMVLLLRRLRRWSDNGYANRLSVDWAGFLLFGDGAGFRALLRGLSSVQIST